MPDEYEQNWIEYYYENGLAWLDTSVQASVKQAFYAGIKAVEHRLQRTATSESADTAPELPPGLTDFTNLLGRR